ncbi:MAG: hypothetical protein ONB31_12535 [candidate division KSB1 bacterium]|nr:hypothetical protein [candidate division KSB1 bacterium]MDZ7334495.1 hypothetical protein [candidate division KSB1 bacterium]MDZ7357958.1 hypothetical protein [candidate division KSB1 bacterium]MDZ7400996.1 hypothetical protein [candidate division KSB1 bacterium]
MERITAIEIPQAVQEKILPLPKWCAIPLESDSNEIPDDVTLGKSV